MIGIYDGGELVALVTIAEYLAVSFEVLVERARFERLAAVSS